MPSFGNATIGEVGDRTFGDNFKVQMPMAINRMPMGQQAGMGNAHIGMNYNTAVESVAQGRLLAADQTPGLNGNMRHMTWQEVTGVWTIDP